MSLRNRLNALEELFPKSERKGERPPTDSLLVFVRFLMSHPLEGLDLSPGGKVTEYVTRLFAYAGLSDPDDREQFEQRELAGMDAEELARFRHWVRPLAERREDR
jgi:hypothetical protein